MTISLGADARSERNAPVPPDVNRIRVKAGEDTAAGCEVLAASDLARAAIMDTANGRLKLEHSAASWQQRADLLRRLSVSFQKRQALDNAERQRAERAEQLAQEDQT